MATSQTDRREFLKLSTAALATSALSMNARSYAAVVGANDRVRTAVVGCGDRMRQALIPAFQACKQENNFEFVAVSDIWSMRRESGQALLKKLSGGEIAICRNNDELYSRKDVDAVLIATEIGRAS